MAFPTSVDSFSTKVDNVSTVFAADVNTLQTAVVAIENFILGGFAGTTAIDLVVRSVTAQAAGPYVGTALPGHVDGQVGDWGGMAFHVQSSKNPSGAAKFDWQQVVDGAITTGTAILTSASNKFTAADVGKLIAVAQAGAAGINLVTTILSFQSVGQVTLAANAGATVTGKQVDWATDDTLSIRAAITALPGAGVGLGGGANSSGLGGGIVRLGMGGCGITGTLDLFTPQKEIILEGAGMRASRMVWFGAGGNPVIAAGKTTPRMGNITVRDFAITAPVPTAVLAGQYGIAVTQGQPQVVNIERLSISNMGSDAIRHGGNSAICHIVGCYIWWNWGYALQVTNESGAGCQNLVFDTNECFGNDGGVGVTALGSVGITITNNDLEGANTNQAGSPHFPMLNIAGNNVWCDGNTCGLVSGATATDCVYINGTNVTIQGGLAGVNQASNNSIHVGSGARSVEIRGVNISGAFALTVGILIDAGAADTFISNPNYVPGLGTNITDNGTRTYYIGGGATQGTSLSPAGVFNTPVVIAASSLRYSGDCRRSSQVPTEAVLVSGVNTLLGELVGPITITAARLVGAPLNPVTGQMLNFILVQGGAGGFAITWNAVFKKTWTDTGNTTGKVSTIAFIFDGTNWQQVGAQSPYV